MFITAHTESRRFNKSSGWFRLISGPYQWVQTLVSGNTSSAKSEANEQGKAVSARPSSGAAELVGGKQENHRAESNDEYLPKGSGKRLSILYDGSAQDLIQPLNIQEKNRPPVKNGRRRCAGNKQTRIPLLSW